ncbi:hypothetical protein BOMU111920_11655 [Bordetella muralis]
MPSARQAYRRAAFNPTFIYIKMIELYFYI